MLYDTTCIIQGNAYLMVAPGVFCNNITWLPELNYFEIKKNFLVKKFLGQKNLGQKIFLVKNILGHKKFQVKQFCVKKNWG